MAAWRRCLRANFSDKEREEDMRELGFYDGRIIEKNEPVICIEDRGYQFGDGVYDAWMVLNGKHFFKERASGPFRTELQNA